MLISEKNIVLIGGGTMAEAIIKGLLTSRVTSPKRITVSELNPDRRSWINEEYGIQVTQPESLDLAPAHIIILAVKPDVLYSVLKRICMSVVPGQLVISVAAGVPLGVVEQALNPAVSVVRVMPNAPAIVQRGMIAVSRGRQATDAEVLLTRSIFSTIGLVMDIDEEHMDIFTVISGSGPAYVFYLMEAMIAAAAQHGLPPARILTIVAETIRGTGELVARIHENPQTMRERLVLPGGPTEAALATLEAGDVKTVIMRAIDTAVTRVRQQNE